MFRALIDIQYSTTKCLSCSVRSSRDFSVKMACMDKPQTLGSLGMSLIFLQSQLKEIQGVHNRDGTISFITGGSRREDVGCIWTKVKFPKFLPCKCGLSTASGDVGLQSSGMLRITEQMMWWDHRWCLSLAPQFYLWLRSTVWHGCRMWKKKSHAI